VGAGAGAVFFRWLDPRRSAAAERMVGIDEEDAA
jgi:hypothetical protein